MTNTKPQYLYRYRHLQGKHREWTSRILTHSVLHFSSPTSFNDPFDCKVHFRSHVSSVDLRRKYASLVKGRIPQLNRTQRRSKVANDINSKNPHELLKQVSIDLQHEIDQLGVLSLSATDRNVLLWSHYAAGHTGLCLKFRAANEHPFFGRAQPVAYPDAYPEVDFLRDSPSRQVEAFLLSKARDWKYEEEWRIIDHDAGSSDQVFPEELLAGVILGAQMTDDDKKAVIEWLHTRKYPVKIYEASVGRASFSLEIKEYAP